MIKTTTMLLHNQYEFNPEKDLIAKGGFAEVFKAYDCNLNRFVAIKRFNRESGKTGSVIKEIQKSIDFNHPNIIRYYNCFAQEFKDHLGRTITEEYGVMEYANAGSLSDIISGKVKVSTEQFKDIILGILDGLHYLHTLPTPIIHRDLKPSNILLQEQGGKLIPKICDFGISKEWQDATTTGTMTGMVGTMEYMSPEQIAGKGIQPNTDLWALGCIIFEYFTGQPPFGKVSSGTSIPALNNNILNATYSTAVFNKIPEPFHTLVKACLVKDTGNRVRSAEESKKILLGKSIKGEPVPPENPFNPWKWVVMILVIAAIFILIAVNLDNQSSLNETYIVKENAVEAPIEELPTAIPKISTSENHNLQEEQQKLAEEKDALEMKRQELETEKQQAEAERLRQQEIDRKNNEYENRIAKEKADAERLIQQDIDRKNKEYENRITKEKADAERLKNNTITSKPTTTSSSAISPIQKLISDMVYVQGGTFTMGCTWEQSRDCIDNEKPTRNITLSSFSIGKYEVTQAQWRAVKGNNPSYFGNCDNCPVEQVSWDDVQDFIKKLNQLSGRKFRLPTEAEWEFAARGGTYSSSTSIYSGSDILGSVGFFYENSNSKSKPVGQKLPNKLGLYDMSGNVWEWCNDWYDKYSNGSQTNPRGPSKGNYKVNRGGSWINFPKACRVSIRNYWQPSFKNDNLGFRLAHD